jgi:hypothetical protein
MWEPRRLTTLWAFMAGYKDSFYLLFGGRKNWGSRQEWEFSVLGQFVCSNLCIQHSLFFYNEQKCLFSYQIIFQLNTNLVFLLNIIVLKKINKFWGFVIFFHGQKSEGWEIEREYVIMLSLPIIMILMGYVVFVPLLKAVVTWILSKSWRQINQHSNWFHECFSWFGLENSRPACT